jgi:hypothetical protein
MKKICFDLSVVIILTLSACEKKFENPPYQPVNDGARLTILALKSRILSTTSIYRFGVGDTNLYCVVTADESSGNIYRQVFVKDDEGGAIQVNLMNSGGLYVGDRIRINLNTLSIISANSSVYLDSVDVEKSVVKISAGNTVLPKVITLSQILDYSSVPTDPLSLQSQLVEINGVEFVPASRGKTISDPIGKTSVNHTLTSCSNQKVLVRTGGFANFAGKPVPGGNGKITAIVSQYNNDIQLILRNYNELQMNSTPCVSTPTTNTGTKIYVDKNFNDNTLTSDGWTNVAVTGNVNWTVSSFNGQFYGKISNFISGGNVVCETWFISPALNLSTSIDPLLSFRNAYKYTGGLLELYVSVNYVSGLPSTATWTKIPFTLSNGDFNFINSGDISLKNYKTTKTRIALKYSGTGSDGSTWEIDDVLVREKE